MEEKYRFNKKWLHPFDGFCQIFFPVIPMWIRPNYLTFIRIIGTPILVYLLWKMYFLASFFLFIILALTDMFDGALARGRNQITYLGILLDPIADKLLIGSIVMVLLFKVNYVLAIAVIGMEVLFLVGGLIKTSQKKAIDLEANFWGKLKMNVQVFGVILMIIGLFAENRSLISLAQYTFWFSLVLAVINFFSRLKYEIRKG